MAIGYHLKISSAPGIKQAGAICWRLMLNRFTDCDRHNQLTSCARMYTVKKRDILFLTITLVSLNRFFL